METDGFVAMDRRGCQPLVPQHDTIGYDTRRPKSVVNNPRLAGKRRRVSSGSKNRSAPRFRQPQLTTTARPVLAYKSHLTKDSDHGLCIQEDPRQEKKEAAVGTWLTAMRMANVAWRRDSRKGLTEQLASKLENEVMLRKRGLIDPAQEKLATQRNKSIQNHLDAF